MNSKIAEGQSVTILGRVFVRGQEKELDEAMNRHQSDTESDAQRDERVSRSMDRLVNLGVLVEDEQVGQPPEEQAGNAAFMPGGRPRPQKFPAPRPGGRRETNPELHPVEDVTLAELSGHISELNREEVEALKAADTRKGSVEIYERRLAELDEAEQRNRDQE